MQKSPLNKEAVNKWRQQNGQNPSASEHLLKTWRPLIAINFLCPREQTHANGESDWAKQLECNQSTSSKYHRLSVMWWQNGMLQQWTSLQVHTNKLFLKFKTTVKTIIIQNFTKIDMASEKDLK